MQADLLFDTAAPTQLLRVPPVEVEGVKDGTALKASCGGRIWGFVIPTVFDDLAVAAAAAAVAASAPCRGVAASSFPGSQVDKRASQNLSMSLSVTSQRLATTEVHPDECMKGVDK